MTPSFSNIVRCATLCLTLLGWCAHAAARETVADPSAFDQMRERIAALGRETVRLSLEAKHQRLEELKSLGQAVEAQYSKSDPEAYAQLAVAICRAFGAVNIGSCQPLYLAQEYAIRALGKKEDISLAAQCDLVYYVRQDRDAEGKKLTGDALAEVRRQQAILWLETWQRIEKTIDKNWDPQDVPLLNVPPPAGAGGFSGMAPEQISDPNLRAEYEAAIEANRRKAANYHVQLEARRLLKRWVFEAERFLIRAYMKEPDRTEELEALLGQYVSDADLRAEILDAVKNKKMPAHLEIPRTQPTQPDR